MWWFLLSTIFVAVQGRAVNISNTWVLPEEGFPVFYRYFRDRISWYEADAVCQFHHANLVTVDTTAQYDAVRAYLKELDISSAVWVGLIRSNPDGDFTWTDYRGLSGDGYWSAAPDARSAPLCAAADPTADYRWEARACGGPSVASFICELPVPQWALGNEGCMVRALPALTVLYLPESAAVQLTADCGLAGVKRVQCTGNLKREDLLKELSCAEEEQTSALPLISSSATPWQSTTELAFSEQESNKEFSTEENLTTEHEDDINQSTAAKYLTVNHGLITSTTNNLLLQEQTLENNLNNIIIDKNVNLNVANNNNLQSNDLPKFVRSDDFFTNEQNERLEDERNMQHKKLHEELARLGNFETIFSQPTDHFVPPLVMAKAKISDDMTALSIEEKLAQQLAERQFAKHVNKHSEPLEINDNKEAYTTDSIKKTVITESPLINLLSSKVSIEPTSNTKYMLPKKYNYKYNDVKSKSLKSYSTKSIRPIKYIEISSTQANIVANDQDKINKQIITKKSSPKALLNESFDSKLNEDTSLELTVVIKEPDSLHNNNNAKPERKINLQEKPAVSFVTESQVILNDEVIKIEIINKKNNHSSIDITVYEVTTKTPVIVPEITTNQPKSIDVTIPNNAIVTVGNKFDELSEKDLVTASVHSIEENITIANPNLSATGMLNTDHNSIFDVVTNNSHIIDTNKEVNITEEFSILSNATIKENSEMINTTDTFEHLEKNLTDFTQDIDDFQSPLLSAASEPLHKPNRSRRPQSLQNRVNKFNPFRILG